MDRDFGDRWTEEGAGRGVTVGWRVGRLGGFLCRGGVPSGYGLGYVVLRSSGNEFVSSWGIFKRGCLGWKI